METNLFAMKKTIYVFAVLTMLSAVFGQGRVVDDRALVLVSRVYFGLFSMLFVVFLVVYSIRKAD